MPSSTLTMQIRSYTFCGGGCKANSGAWPTDHLKCHHHLLSGIITRVQPSPTAIWRSIASSLWCTATSPPNWYVPLVGAYGSSWPTWSSQGGETTEGKRKKRLSETALTNNILMARESHNHDHEFVVLLMGSTNFLRSLVDSIFFCLWS